MILMIRYILGLALCGLLSITTFAQRPGHGGGHHGPERLLQQLDLTEQQRTQLQTLRAEQRAKMEAFRQKEFATPEARHTAMRTLRQEGKAALESILTEAQTAKLNELQAQRRAERPKVDRKALREDVRTYRKDNIRPVMVEQRAKLEPLLSAEDKALIATLRPKAKQAKRELREGMRQLKETSRATGERPDRSQLHAQRKALEAKYADEIEQVQDLVTKYESDIDRLLAEVADEKAEWKDELRDIVQEHRGERHQGRGHRRPHAEGTRPHGGKHGRRPGMERLQKAHFLLMKPSPNPGSIPAPGTSGIGISPNPATADVSVRYELVADGPVQLTLQNAEGKQLRILLNGIQTAGTQRHRFDVSDLPGGVYYLVIRQGSETRTERFVVGNR